MISVWFTLFIFLVVMMMWKGFRKIQLTVIAAGLILMTMTANYYAGNYKDQDTRLRAEPWRLMAVSPLANDEFLVISKFISNGDLKFYKMNLSGNEKKKMLENKAKIDQGANIVVNFAAKKKPAGTSNGDQQGGSSMTGQIGNGKTHPDGEDGDGFNYETKLEEKPVN